MVGPRLGVLAALLVLGACASSPPPRSPGEPTVHRTPASPAPARPAAPGAGGTGGYYLDDGPHAETPANLAAIPEPEPRVEPLHRFANNPYNVFGQVYTPERALRRSVSRGVASWYGRRFHGNRTAIGEIYDMFQLTAAHPTLPLPSYARVTNLANGRSVVVRVNDRGPFLRGRAMDLSYAAAARLGYIDQGFADVEIESIDPTDMVSRAPVPVEAPASRAPDGPPPRAVAPPPPIAAKAPAPGGLPVVEERGAHYVQLGAFQSSANAESMLARLIFQSEQFERNLRIVLKSGLHRVLAGPYPSRPDAQEAALQLRGLQ